MIDHELKQINRKLDLLWLLLTIMADQSGIKIDHLDLIAKDVGWQTEGSK